MPEVLGKKAIEWLLEGDAAIRWQTMRDLLGRAARTVAGERRRVAATGWGARLLAKQDAAGTWGGGLYTPKWTSATYTLLLLRSMGLDPRNGQARRGCRLLIERGRYFDGGINFVRGYGNAETCLTGMALALAVYFRMRDPRVEGLVEYLLREQMPDGGWNCQLWRGATHGSFHTTILVLEGLREYEQWRPERGGAVRRAQELGREFFLRHRLFRSHRTGVVVKAAMTRFSFPPRWHYDVLRGLDYFRDCDAAREERLAEAIGIVRARRRADGRWVLRNRYPGQTFFEMERPGQPSRWNTLRALRVLRWWEDGEGGFASDT